jgi:AraC family transcriptional regulator
MCMADFTIACHNAAKIAKLLANYRRPRTPSRDRCMSQAKRSTSLAEPWRTIGGLRMRMVRYQPGAVQPRHCHAEPGLSLVVAGTIEESSSSSVHRAAAGSLVVKPADCWHADSFGPRGARLVQVMPEGDDFAAPRTKLAYLWCEAPRLARLLLGLWNDPSTGQESTELAYWETIERLLPSVQGLGGAIAPGWWPSTLELLDAEATRSVSVAAIARRVGVHPVHLARVCRRQTGCSVREYLRRRRTLEAWRACEQNGKPLAAIAASTGFADQAHMTRAFHRELGISPARLRRLLQS